MISSRPEKESIKEENAIKKKKIGLALSGGGYRAAAFHLGTLRKLQELQLLDKVDVISTISGGSIAGAYYALHKDDFDEFTNGFTAALKKSVIRKIILSFGFIVPIVILLLTWIGSYFLMDYLKLGAWFPMLIIFVTLVFIRFFQFWFLNLTKLKIAAYRRIFFGGKTLGDLPEVPKMAINATNLETGTLFTYSRKKVSDSSYQYPKDGGASIKFDGAIIPVAMAVGSSTAVPALFNPVKIDKKYLVNPEDYKRINPGLIDGGLYDNQGIHKITQWNSEYHCDIIICSDGSQPFKYKFNGKNSISILYRGIDVMFRKIKNLQFIRDVYGMKREIAYFSLDWQYENSLVEFAKSVAEGKLTSELLAYHGINPDEYQDGNKINIKAIGEYISKRINFDQIIKGGLSVEQVGLISKIGTNLTALSDERIRLLSTHAATLTELQIKLYCPSLI
jgi:NTE family protein